MTSCGSHFIKKVTTMSIITVQPRQRTRGSFGVSTVLGAVMALGLLAGCASGGTKVRGDWQGQWDGAQDGIHRQIDLVLNYGPGRHAGDFRLHVQKIAQDQGDNAGAGLNSTYWSGQWTDEKTTIAGHTWTVIHLADVPVREVSTYYVGPDGELIPLHTGQTAPDLSERFSAERLALVPPGSFGYGRI